MSDPLLLYGAPGALPDLWHSVPAAIVDPFLYGEAGGRRFATVSSLDSDKVAALGVEILDPYELGADELLSSGIARQLFEVEIALRACRAMDIDRALVPSEFPLGVADHLRRNGVAIEVEPETFVARRRAKTEVQLAGIRRAQAAADAAMGVAAELIRELRPGLMSEGVRFAMQAACAEHGCELADDVIVAGGPHGADGHESGHGPLEAGTPVVVDIWPRDPASRCWSDMTRTFVAGGGAADAELATFWQLCRASLERVHAGIRAGADASALYRESCEPFIEAGQPTQLTKEPGTVLRDGYFHSLGHGVGLEVHERPNLGRTPDRLVAGDVIAVEPGCYRRGYGGCRLEDLVLVTAGGSEVLTDFPYDL